MIFLAFSRDKWKPEGREHDARYLMRWNEPIF